MQAEAYAAADFAAAAAAENIETEPGLAGKA